jgi:poly-beta-1,6-N-acetyl-D-glucosamine synthase
MVKETQRLHQRLQPRLEKAFHMPAATAIGIMAYNEERNIGSLLESILSQTSGASISRIVVVASGCTDRTCEIVSDYARRDPRVVLIEEPDRAGKTAAVNKFLLTAEEKILMVSSADLIFQPHTVEKILRPFTDDEVGMVGAHAVPLNANDNFFGYASGLMWALHHEISLRDPKMGELIAFRNVFRRLNPAAICDELSVYQLVRSAGYKIAYAPEAIVYNKGPGTLSDFISQRMHCIVGNLAIMREHNVHVSTMRTLPVLRAALPHALRNWKRLLWTIGAAMLELYCRLKSQSVYRSQRRRKEFQVWEPASTTKALTPDSPQTKTAH